MHEIRRGLEACRTELREIGNGELEEMLDCTDPFAEIASYFHARLFRCPRRDSTWLGGYYEENEDVLGG